MPFGGPVGGVIVRDGGILPDDGGTVGTGGGVGCGVLFIVAGVVRFFDLGDFLIGVIGKL